MMPSDVGDFVEGESLAAAALLEWTRGRCWIGRDVARGLGWMRLVGLQAFRLDAADARVWPNSGKEPWQTLDDLPQAKRVRKEQFATVFVSLPISDRWRYIELDCSLSLGQRKGGYGLDAMAVGGHSAVEDWSNCLLLPEGRGAPRTQEESRRTACS